MVVICVSLPVQTDAKDVIDTLVVNRLYRYRESVDSSLEGMTTHAYVKYKLKTDRRNVLLYCVPHLHTMAKTKNRNPFFESFVQLIFHQDGTHDMEKIAKTGTISRRRTIMPNVMEYLVPHIYGELLYPNRLLSPFHRRNHRFYRYRVHHVEENLVYIGFKPRAINTQTVHGNAVVDLQTGRIVSCTLVGEYDMVSFELKLEMGEEGPWSLVPKRCWMKTKFTFLGNKLRAIYDLYMHVPSAMPWPIGEVEMRPYIAKIRPDSLSEEEQTLYAKSDSVDRMRTSRDTIRIRKKNIAKDILWDVIGESLIHRIKGNFGNDDKGYYRLSPILNPLYLSYSERRGLNYRFTIRGGYDFSANREIRTRTKLGYSFKLKQFLVNIPITYTFDKSHNGYIEGGWRSGEHITNSTIVDKLKEERGDTIDWKKMNLDYFRHTKQYLSVHYDFNPYFGMEAGYVFNRWRSVQSKNFDLLDKPTHYKSTSWMCEFSVRPWGYHGPIFTINYERTLKKLSEKGMNYEKWEYDCSYLYRMPLMRSISMRAGAGYYTTHTKDTYFLDYNNFREDNIPGGWNDEWSGEFELLHRNWYNSSKYYLRMNATYESPVIFLSWVPVIGNIVETERFYLSALRLSALSNYVEIGYGFTNRLCSVGFFTSLKRGKYESFGCKLGFELFNKW